MTTNASTNAPAWASRNSLGFRTLDARSGGVLIVAMRRKPFRSSSTAGAGDGVRRLFTFPHGGRKVEGESTESADESEPDSCVQRFGG